MAISQRIAPSVGALAGFLKTTGVGAAQPLRSEERKIDALFLWYFIGIHVVLCVMATVCVVLWYRLAHRQKHEGQQRTKVSSSEQKKKRELVEKIFITAGGEHYHVNMKCHTIKNNRTVKSYGRCGHCSVAVRLVSD